MNTASDMPTERLVCTLCVLEAMKELKQKRARLFVIYTVRKDKKQL